MNPDNLARCRVCGERIVFQDGQYYHAYWNGIKKDEE